MALTEGFGIKFKLLKLVVHSVLSLRLSDLMWAVSYRSLSKLNTVEGECLPTAPMAGQTINT